MKILIAFLLSITVVYGILENKIRYDNFQVYRLTPRSKEALEAIKNLEVSGYDFWTSAKGVGNPVDVMVPPHLKHSFNITVSSEAVDVKIFISDVQKLIDDEKPKGLKPRALEWREYHTLEEIDQYLTDLSNQYPNQVSLVEAGRSYEGRLIRGVKVSFAPGNEQRTVFIESNIHAREWITSAVSTWILNELLTSNAPNVRAIANSHDWYFVPVFNVDGFVYTHTVDRMWRKTRTPNFRCVGVDPNRNWGYHFGDGGASASPCSINYRGVEAFSEPSMRSLSEFITGINPPLYAYIGLHSYSQLLLIPYGFSTAHVDNYDELFEVGQKAIAKLTERHGTEYKVGNIVEVLYVASGGSMDWVKGTFGTRITYTYELRDTGRYGFILPPDQIVPCAQETFDSLLTIFEEFRNRTS